jgi:hypothetical protein
MWIPRGRRLLVVVEVTGSTRCPTSGSGSGDVFMLGSLVLETVIGLVFVYLIFSLIASALTEYLSALLDRRGEHLKHLLLNMFDTDDPRGQTMLNLFVGHPMVQALRVTDWKRRIRAPGPGADRGMSDLDRAQARWDSAARTAAAAAAARTEAGTASTAAARARVAASSLRADGGPTATEAIQATLDAARDAEAAARAAQDARAQANQLAASIKSNRDLTEAETPSPPPTPAGPRPDGILPTPRPTQNEPSDLNPTAARERATGAATAATDAAREASQAASVAERAARGLDQELVQSIAVPRYIPDRTFAEVLVHLLTSGQTLTALAREVAPPSAQAVPTIPLATFWARFTAALQIVRGIASRLPATSGDSRSQIETALSSLEESVRRVGGGIAEASAVIGHLEAGINQLRAAVAAVPDDALRTELTRAVEVSLQPLRATGQDILVLECIGLAISKMADSSIKTALSASLQQAGEELSAFKRNLASWFNEIMDHASGWYKRNTQRILMVIALVLCTLNNVDTVALVQHLTTDPQLRVDVSEQAIASRGQGLGGPPAPSASPGTGGAQAKEIEEALAKSHLPLWWSQTEWDNLWSEPASATNASPRFSPHYWRLLAKATGLLLSVLAVSMGAPFWFDILGRLVNVRLSEPRPEPSVGKPTPAGQVPKS